MTRAVAQEAAVLLTYLLGEPPAPELADRYIRGLRVNDLENPLPLPGLVRHRPWLIRFLEPVGSRSTVNRDALAFRLQLATVIVEASSQERVGAYDYDGRSRLTAIARFAALSVSEGLLVAVRAILQRIWRW